KGREPGRERGRAQSLPGEHGGFSAATLRVLASMPSRTIGERPGQWERGWGAHHGAAAHQGRRRPRRPPDPVPAPCAAEKRSLLAKELLGLSPGQRGRLLRAVPLSLAEKRSLRWVAAAPLPQPAMPP
uniref:Uncharacterized protein n=1 Tax=Nothoprocta perdicaria TaxID=30464 RepID=A0A8C7EE77_NOTPE